MGKTKEQVKTKVDKILSQPYRLDLHNDDFNSFEWVVTCLIKVCEHEYEQAYQCALLVHDKGICDVKYGNYDTISEMKDRLVNAGLSVTLEVN